MSNYELFIYVKRNKNSINNIVRINTIHTIFEYYTPNAPLSIVKPEISQYINPRSVIKLLIPSSNITLVLELLHKYYPKLRFCVKEYKRTI